MAKVIKDTKQISEYSEDYRCGGWTTRTVEVFYCGNCNNELSTVGKFCPQCGEAIRYEGEKVCGECLPCTHLKEALFSLTLNNNEVGERAKEMLKSRFGITVSVAYKTEEKAVEESTEEYVKES